MMFLAFLRSLSYGNLNFRWAHYHLTQFNMDVKMVFRTQDPYHPNVYGARIVIAHQSKNTPFEPLNL